MTLERGRQTRADEFEYIFHARLVPRAPWSVILAGGDGVRLRSLTRATTGEARPKQFCPLLDGETLLERTVAASTC